MSGPECHAEVPTVVLGPFHDHHRRLSTDPYPQKRQTVPRGMSTLVSYGLLPVLNPTANPRPVACGEISSEPVVASFSFLPDLSKAPAEGALVEWSFAFVPPLPPHTPVTATC